MCAQRKATKRISTEEDFIKSNIESFGNEIGQTTNYITSMFEVQSKFKPGSDEYEILGYRIKCGQLYQQNAIDKAKGIICKPMPRSWHDRHSVNNIDDDATKDLYRSIAAVRKPYFMRYIYPSLMKEYNTYIKNTNRNALREFQMTIDEMNALPYGNLTDRQREFLRYYNQLMPVGDGNCIMNRICRKFEDEFDKYISKHNYVSQFDYTIMKSDAEYTPQQLYNIKRLYDDYNKRLAGYAVFADYERTDSYESISDLATMNDEFLKQCERICPNRSALCNIVLDLCYRKSSTKRFAWSMCADEIIKNLLVKNNNIISYPYFDEDGEIEYCGEKFSLGQIEIEVTKNNDTVERD